MHLISCLCINIHQGISKLNFSRQICKIYQIFMYMKMYSQYILLFILMCIQSNIVHAQTGIHYYTDSALLDYNTSIVDIKESADGNTLYLLGKIENEDFTYTEGPWFARLDKSAQMIFARGWFEERMNDVLNIILLPLNKQNSKAKIYGNTRQGQFFNTYYKVVNDKAQKSSDFETLTIYSSLLRSVYDIGNGQSYELWLVQDSNYTYNIRLKRTNTLTGKVLKSININSKLDEEVDKMDILTSDSSIVLLSKSFDSPYLDSYSSTLFRVSSNGDSIWTKAIPESNGFKTQAVCIRKNNESLKEQILISCCVPDSNAKIIALDIKGNVIQRKEFSNLKINGMLSYNNYTLIFGSENDTIGSNMQQRIVSRARILELDSNLNIVKQFKHTNLYKPDIDFKGIMHRPFSTELYCATVLSNGRIAFGGRAYLPKDCSPEGQPSSFTNRPLLIVLDKNLSFNDTE